MISSRCEPYLSTVRVTNFSQRGRGASRNNNFVQSTNYRQSQHSRGLCWSLRLRATSTYEINSLTLTAEAFLIIRKFFHFQSTHRVVVWTIRQRQSVSTAMLLPIAHSPFNNNNQSTITCSHTNAQYNEEIPITARADFSFSSITPQTQNVDRLFTSYYSRLVRAFQRSAVGPAESEKAHTRGQWTIKVCC